MMELRSALGIWWGSFYTPRPSNSGLGKWLVCIVAEQEEVEVVEVCTVTVLEEEEEAGVGLLKEQEGLAPAVLGEGVCNDV